jgi:STE24 endopeptidase
MQSYQYVTILFISFLMVKEIIESILEYRNKKNVIKNRNKVPVNFMEKVTLEEHQKAADYTVAKINAGQIFNLIDFFILLGWTIGGGLNQLDMWVRSLGISSLWMGGVFIFSFGIISYILHLPHSLYSTFILEEKFGFNKTTPKTFVIDTIKSLVLSVLIGGPLILAILWVMERYRDNWWIIAWALLTSFQLLMVWAYPVFIAPLFNKFSHLEDGEVKNKVLDLLKRTGFKSKGLFVMNASMRSSHGNAYFTGFGKNKRIVFFDTLIKTLEPDEVESVLAHELGHYKKKHILKSMIKSILITLLGFFILKKVYDWSPFYLGHGARISSSYMALLLFGLVSGIYTFFLTPINAWFSRKNEFEADEFAAENSKASKLISALVKLYKDNASTLTPDPLYSSYHYSHPPALERVKFLEKLSSR